MELDVCIKGRRSVRAYKDEPVSKEQIETVLEAGVWAPTGMNRQPWKFIVIENKQLIKYVSEETKILVQQAMPPIAKQFQTEADVICYNAPMLVPSMRGKRQTVESRESIRQCTRDSKYVFEGPRAWAWNMLHGIRSAPKQQVRCYQKDWSPRRP